jgi:phosphoserine phosphatase
MTGPDDKTRVRDLQKVLEISRAMAAARDLDDLLGLILDRSMELLEAERATVFLYDPARDELTSRVARQSGEIRMPAGQGIAGACVRERAVVNVPDAYADERFNADFDRRGGFHTRNILALPLWGCTGDLVGVLEIINKRGGGFGPYDISLAETLAAQAGVVIQRARLLDQYVQKQRMQRSLEIAREIQRGLLPKGDPVVAGFDIAGFSAAADETGGDIYDFIGLSGGRLAVVVADASGHGIGPALVIAETRAMLRALAGKACDVPAVMSAVNDLLSQDLGDERFVTCFLGVLDPAGGLLTFASAGHGPILFYDSRAGTFEELPATTVPLGIFGGISFDGVVARRLRKGDFAAIVTDGLFEATPGTPEPDGAGEQFGIPRIRDLLGAARGLPAREMIARLHKAVADWSAGGPQADDMTAVIIRKL